MGANLATQVMTKYPVMAKDPEFRDESWDSPP
jgi:hypothetical protein